VSSTSTNKQPMLVDRPLHEFAALGPTPGLIDPLNFASVLAGGCVPLVDCINENRDGAMVDSLSIVANQANTTAAKVVFFLSVSPSALGVNGTNTLHVASAGILSSQAGERVNVPLPALNVPVPNLGGQTSPTETSKKNTGLHVPKGRILYVGLSEPLLLPTPIATVNIFAQGGYY
jgi:hypothetical protein